MKEAVLHTGFEFNGAKITTAKILPSNGIAEQVFADKQAAKPYTWMANVISVACSYIGNVPVAEAYRAEFLANRAANIPPVVRAIPIQDVSTLLVEIHRLSWENLLPKQPVVCGQCAKTLYVDVDLDRITLSEEDAQLILNNPDGFNKISVDLKDGFVFKAIGDADHKMFMEYDGMQANYMEFRVPTLGDALMLEEHVSDNIVFWRKIAQMCRTVVGVKDATGVVPFPDNAMAMMGANLYDATLSGRDLKAIRTALRESLPGLPFNYEETCPCPSKAKIWVNMEASSFFS